ncbi:type VI secretion system accessory protein TagJ [Paludibaculum fermentans]|uniref:Virulence protein SciE type n=1 Tax=Paludibaculum fermentans TaxID=1473598 RepID=A0A7S7SLV3_PALFE|nr:type VI secretion system accessory protein TagJ [Paludibaculum fermentans]QOY88435.1 virulence protein SciE type [Paludibaculum fermentans]
MGAAELYRDGKLKEAIQALGAEIRDNPTDLRRRTFLFELLCLAGEYERASKHLSLLSSVSPDAEIGAIVYRSALVAERERQNAFEKKQYPETDNKVTGKALSGTLNGRPFHSIEDADPRIGMRFEVFVAGEYVWLPMEYVVSIKIEQPRFLRDTIWCSALIDTSPQFGDKKFGEVLMPAIYPLSWQHEDNNVKLGRATEWQDSEEGGIPFGQRMLVLDGEEAIPFLEVRDLQICAATEASAEADAVSAQ